MSTDALFDISARPAIRCVHLRVHITATSIKPSPSQDTVPAFNPWDMSRAELVSPVILCQRQHYFYFFV